MFEKDVRVIPCDNRVCSVIWTEPAQESSTNHARTTHGVPGKERNILRQDPRLKNEPSDQNALRQIKSGTSMMDKNSFGCLDISVKRQWIKVSERRIKQP